MLHWRKVVRIDAGTPSRLNKIKFITNNICIIIGGEKYDRSDILRSEDGGYTWSDFSSSESQKGIYGISVSPEGHIYVSGIDGGIFMSADSGKTWRFKRILDWRFYHAISFPVNDTGIVINSMALDTCHISQIDTNCNIIDQRTYRFALSDIYMVSPSTGYLIGYGVVMKTTDYRRTWTYQNVRKDQFTAMDIHGEEIWMCGSNGGIFHTTDGGGNWEQLRNGNDITHVQYHLCTIVFKDKLNGWAAGEQGKIIYTDDAGKHWSEYDYFTDNAIRSLVLCPNGDLLAAGDNGTLFRITP